MCLKDERVLLYLDNYSIVNEIPLAHRPLAANTIETNCESAFTTYISNVYNYA